MKSALLFFAKCLLLLTCRLLDGIIYCGFTQLHYTGEEMNSSRVPALAKTDRLRLRLDDKGDNFTACVYADRGISPATVLGRLKNAISFADENAPYSESINRAIHAVELGERYNDAIQNVNISISNCADANVTKHLRAAHHELRQSPWQSYASSYARNNFFLQIPERKSLDGQDHWKLSGTDSTAITIEKWWPRDQIIFEDGAETLYSYLLMQSHLQDENVRNVALWADSKQVPKHNFEMHDDRPLSPYQQLALVNSFNSEGYGLFMDAGTGKTPIVIARVCNMSKTCKHVVRAIIVCPNNVRANWAAEFQQFATVPGRVTVIRGHSLQRRKQFIDAFTLDKDDQFTAVILSYDTLMRVWEEVSMIPWDLAVGDESHYFKNSRTHRFKAMMKLRDISRYRMPLTGTPITNHHLDLYAHFEFMGRGYSGFMSQKNFKTHYATLSRGSGGHEIMEGTKNIPELKHRLARLSFQIKLEEAVPDLPGKVYDIYEVEMTKRQAEVYEEVKKNLIYEIEQAKNSSMPKAMVVQHILTKLLRLTQITSGFVVWDAVYTDDGDVVSARAEEDIDEVNPKIAGLLDIMSTKGPNEKTIVWATFVHDIKAITAALTNAGYDCVEYYGATSERDRAEAERRYNTDPNCTVLVGNPAAGGTGLNLIGWDYRDETDDPRAKETNTTQEIYYSQNWSPVEREQSEARGYRRRARARVRVTDLCIPNTQDEIIRTRVLKKRVNALETSDVSSILKEVLGIDYA